MQAGNKAFQQQRYDAAAEAYSKALDTIAGDAAFQAVVLCNRAAAQLGAGRCVDAVADCFQVSGICDSKIGYLHVSTHAWE